MITFGEEAVVLYLYFIALWRYDEEYFVVYGFANAYGNNPHIKAFTLLIQIISFNFADQCELQGLQAEGPSLNAGDGYFWG
jgi:hypothetical protein